MNDKKLLCTLGETEENNINVYVNVYKHKN